MQYRYYVLDTETNVGVSQYSTEFKGLFAEALADILEWLMWESDSTLDYKVTIRIKDIKTEVEFRYDEDKMYAYFDGHPVSRESVRDYIKSTF